MQCIISRVSRASQPTVAEIIAHPTYSDTVFNLTPTQSGKLPVAAKRGGPFNIDWQVHGKGDIKLVVCLTSLRVVARALVQPGVA